MSRAYDSDRERGERKARNISSGHTNRHRIAADRHVCLSHREPRCAGVPWQCHFVRREGGIEGLGGGKGKGRSRLVFKGSVQ